MDEPRRPALVPMRLRRRARDPAAPSVYWAAAVRPRPSSKPAPPRLRCPAQERLVGEVVKLLGVSENTVRCMEAEGMITKAQRMELARGKSVRAFTAQEVERIATKGCVSAAMTLEAG